MTCKNKNDISNLIKGVDKSGEFDVLIRGLQSYLDREYTSGRIEGAEYTKAFIALIEASISGGVQAMTAMAQIRNVDKNTELVEAQIRNTNAQTESVCAQKCLTLQRIETERSNTQDKDADGTAYTGVQGAQIKLLAKQARAFDQDAAQKRAKLYTDAYNMQLTAGLEPIPADYGLGSAPTKSAMTSLDSISTPV